MAKETIGKRLRRLREEAGLSQRQLAFPGCTSAYISRIESDDRIPSVRTIRGLAAGLRAAGARVTDDYLESGEEPVDLVGELYQVADDQEAAVLDELRLRAGQTWECLVCERGWTNRRDDPVCGRCGVPVEIAKVGLPAGVA